VRATIYHNPRCTTSRKAKELLEGAGVQLEVVEYLKGRVSREDWAALVDAVGGDPTKLLRSREPLYKDLKLAAKVAAGKLGREQVIDLLWMHPQLLERPVVVAEDRGIIARPAEKVQQLL
jgi:arsenate reductase